MNPEELRHAEALAYVWGRRDEREHAGGNPGTCGGSGEFAEWYCVAQRQEHHTMQDRYAEWVAAGFPDGPGDRAGSLARTRRGAGAVTSPELVAFATLRRAEDFARSHGDTALADDLYALGLWLGAGRVPRTAQCRTCRQVRPYFRGVADLWWCQVCIEPIECTECVRQLSADHVCQSSGKDTT